jgi:hypothetical protein
VTRPNKASITIATLALAATCWITSGPLARGGVAGAVVLASTHSRHHRHATGCRTSARNVPALPQPLVSFEAPYVPGRCDPMRLLPKQARRLFACVRWREGGDTPDEPNGAGMYQFTNRATWDEFRGRFPEVPSEATALQQDIVAYRAWRTEQFLPWNGDPCVGTVHEYGKWGWY